MKKSVFKESLVATGIFIFLLVIIYLGIEAVWERGKEEQKDFLEKGAIRAIVQCYAIEGMYPPDIAYLEDHYGIMINHDRYIVHYEIFASNIMPQIVVIEKKRGD